MEDVKEEDEEDDDMSDCEESPRGEQLLAMKKKANKRGRKMRRSSSRARSRSASCESIMENELNRSVCSRSPVRQASFDSEEDDGPGYRRKHSYKNIDFGQ